MAIASTDIVVYGAASIAEDDVSTQGGAIATTVRYIFDSASLVNTLADTVEILSSSVSDTSQTVTITGRSVGGSIVSETLSLNGTSVVSGSTTFQRILKIVVSASHAGTITVRKATGDTTIVAIETGVLTVRKPFYNVASDKSGGSARSFYEKIFIKNNHATLSLLSAVVAEDADPTTQIGFDIESSVNGSNSIASRLNTVPSNMLGSFDSNSKNVPGTDLAAGSRIGVWLKLTLAAGDAPILSTYTLSISGSSI